MALTKKVNFTRFSRFGANLGRLTYTAATHEDATDGTDELKIRCDEDLSKGEYLVWVDRQGVVHEHIVDAIERLHDDNGKPYTSVTCINSINETWDDYIEDKRPSGSVAVALTSILAGTRWEVGNCDQPGSASHTFYHVKVREGLSDLLKTWGGELETVIETDGVRVTHRYVRVVAKRGNQQSPKRFTWTKDLISIKRKTGSANPKTRVYGYGKGVETDGGGFGRRLTFGDINGGKNYVEDTSATEVWGHPDGNGGIAPAVDVYVNEQCEDAAQLLAETNDYLEHAKTPSVSYEASVIDLFAFGRDWESVAVGDCVAIIDKGFSAAGIRLKGRVSKLTRDLVTGDATVAFGNLTDDLADIFQSMAQQLKSGSNQRANYDAAAGTSVSWLNQLMAALNKAFNAVGTYKVETFELGVIYSNVPHVGGKHQRHGHPPCRKSYKRRPMELANVYNRRTGERRLHQRRNDAGRPHPRRPAHRRGGRELLGLGDRRIPAFAKCQIWRWRLDCRWRYRRPAQRNDAERKKHRGPWGRLPDKE